MLRLGANWFGQRREKLPERTKFTPGALLQTVTLAYGDYQSVRLVVYLHAGAPLAPAHGGGRVRRSHARIFRPPHRTGGHTCQRPLEQFPNFFVISILWKYIVPSKHASRVGVYHEHGMITGIEQNRIRCFRSDAV